MIRRCWNTRGTCRPTTRRQRPTSWRHRFRAKGGRRRRDRHRRGRSCRLALPTGVAARSGPGHQPEHWDELRLATWLCRNLPEPSLTHASKQAFVAAWLTRLLQQEGFTLARANLQKFLIRNLLEARIRELRKRAVGRAFQQTRCSAAVPSRVAVTDQYAFEFHAQAYAPSRDYDGRLASSISAGISTGRIGDFGQQGGVRVRLLARHPGTAGRIEFLGAQPGAARRQFFIPAEGRRPFYPDFLCQLPGMADQPGPVLAVEYKGANGWLIARTTARSAACGPICPKGRCRFVMVTDKRWEGSRNS